MRRFTNAEKTAGEKAIKNLDKAIREKIWDAEELISIYEYDDHGAKRYACAGEIKKEGLTLEELEKVLCDMVITYHIIDKDAYCLGDEMKHYTFEELKEVFNPRERFDAEFKEECPERYKEMLERWEDVEELWELEDYLRWEYDGYAVPYKFERDCVENIKIKEGINEQVYSSEHDDW